MRLAGSATIPLVATNHDPQSHSVTRQGHPENHSRHWRSPSSWLLVKLLTLEELPTVCTELCTTVKRSVTRVGSLQYQSTCLYWHDLIGKCLWPHIQFWHVNQGTIITPRNATGRPPGTWDNTAAHHPLVHHGKLQLREVNTNPHLLQFGSLLSVCRWTLCGLVKRVKHRTWATLDNVYFGIGNWTEQRAQSLYPCPWLHVLAEIQHLVEFPEKSYTGQCIKENFFS